MGETDEKLNIHSLQGLDRDQPGIVKCRRGEKITHKGLKLQTRHLLSTHFWIYFFWQSLVLLETSEMSGALIKRGWNISMCPLTKLCYLPLALGHMFVRKSIFIEGKNIWCISLVHVELKAWQSAAQWLVAEDNLIIAGTDYHNYHCASPTTKIQYGLVHIFRVGGSEDILLMVWIINCCFSLFQ